MKEEIGIQIINFTNFIEVLVVKKEPNCFNPNITSTSRMSYYDFLQNKYNWKFSMNGVTKSYHNTLESAIEHIMAGRTSYGEYPQLVSNDVKIDAIAKCQKVFNRINKIKKVEDFKQSISDKLNDAYSSWKNEKDYVDSKVEAFKKEINF